GWRAPGGGGRFSRAGGPAAVPQAVGGRRVSPRLEGLAAAPEGPLAVRQRQVVEDGERPRPAAGERGQHLPVLVLGPLAPPQPQQAVGEQQADLKERRIEVEG